jgi:hypothetical protein
MLNQILLYVGSGVIFLWGVGHIIPMKLCPRIKAGMALLFVLGTAI